MNKKVILSIFAIMSFFCVNAQSELKIGVDTIWIGNEKFIPEKDDYIYLDAIMKINKVSLGEGLKGNSHSIRCYSSKSKKYVFDKKSMSRYFTADFTIGNDTIKVYIDGDLKYSLVPKNSHLQVDQQHQRDDKTILIVYNDSILVSSNDSIYLSVKKGNTCKLKKPISINWLSFRVMNNKNEYKVCIQKIGKNASTLFHSSIVTEASCSFTLGNDTIAVIIDNDTLCTIAPEVEFTNINEEIVIDDKNPKIWIAFIAVIGFILFLVFIELVMQRAAKRASNHPGSKDQHDYDKQKDSPYIVIPADLSFEILWERMTEQQHSDAVTQLSSTYHLTDIGELEFDQLLQLMTEEQCAAAKQRFLQEVNLQAEIQKISADDLIRMMTKEQCEALKLRFIPKVNIKDEMQKLSVEKLLEFLSKEQEEQLAERYKTTVVKTNTITKTVDVKEMSVDRLYSAMDSNQLMEVVSRYFNNDKVSDKVWSVVSLKLLTTDDVLEKKHTIEIVQEMLNREDDEVWNCVAQIIARKFNPAIENSNLQYPDTWKALSTKLSDPKKYAVEIIQKIIQKDDEDVLNYVAEVIAGKFNPAIENSNLQYPDTWKALSTKLSNPKKYVIEIMQEMLQQDEEEIWDFVAKVIAEKVNPTIEDNSYRYPDNWNALSSLLSNPNVIQFDFDSMKKELDTTKAKLTGTENELGEAKTKLADTENELGETKKKLTDTENELGETKAKLTGTENELGETKAKLTGTENELGETKAKLTSTENELGEAKAKLTGTENELGEAKTKLADTENELGETKKKLTDTENELGETKAKLTGTENELKTTIQKWIKSMKNLRDDMMSIPIEIKESFRSIYSGDNSVMLGMVDRVINDRRSNLLKFIDKGGAIEIDKDTTMDAIKVSIREMFIEDLGGQYPGWVDIMMRLYAYTKVSFLREDLKKNGLNVDYVTSAAEQTLQLMKLVGIHAVIPDLFKSKYDSTLYDLEPIRTIDRIIPSASSHAKSGIVADIYRIGYTIESINQSKKAIVSIY